MKLKNYINNFASFFHLIKKNLNLFFIIFSTICDKLLYDQFYTIKLLDLIIFINIFRIDLSALYEKLKREQTIIIKQKDCQVNAPMLDTSTLPIQ